MQLLWRNPPNFKANSGEYVQVRIPWLQKGAREFHPFSIYMQEGTKEGEWYNIMIVYYYIQLILFFYLNSKLNTYTHT